MRDIPFVVALLVGSLLVVNALAHPSGEGEVATADERGEQRTDAAHLEASASTRSRVEVSPLLRSAIPRLELRTSDTNALLRDFIRSAPRPDDLKPSSPTWWMPAQMSYVDPVVARQWQRPL